VVQATRKGAQENHTGGPKALKSESRLKKVLTANHFAVTAECGPPKGAAPEAIRKKGALLKAFVDSVNVTVTRQVSCLSSLAACVLLRKTAGSGAPDGNSRP
jgi:methylenetetrahydrofolate reductase (NADPH)